MKEPDDAAELFSIRKRIEGTLRNEEPDSLAVLAKQFRAYIVKYGTRRVEKLIAAATKLDNEVELMPADEYKNRLATDPKFAARVEASAGVKYLQKRGLL